MFGDLSRLFFLMSSFTSGERNSTHVNVCIAWPEEVVVAWRSIIS